MFDRNFIGNIGDERARAGGEMLPDGEAFKGGEFMPHYVPRTIMPQVDEADLPALIDWLHGEGVATSTATVDPWTVKVHQRIAWDKSRTMPDNVLAKPVLVSADNVVIDGNHRWLGHVIRSSDMNVIVVGLPFKQAIHMIERSPVAYEYGDGHKHPIRN